MSTTSGGAPGIGTSLKTLRRVGERRGQHRRLTREGSGLLAFVRDERVDVDECLDVLRPVAAFVMTKPPYECADEHDRPSIVSR